MQEGEQPPEDPQQLIDELERTAIELEDLIQRINRTNAVTEFEAGETLCDALARRDILMLKRNTYDSLVSAAAIFPGQYRYSRSEVRFISTVEVASIQQRIDNLARDYRELDARIQALNWQTDVLEN